MGLFGKGLAIPPPTSEDTKLHGNSGLGREKSQAGAGSGTQEEGGELITGAVRPVGQDPEPLPPQGKLAPGKPVGRPWATCQTHRQEHSGWGGLRILSCQGLGSRR